MGGNNGKPTGKVGVDHRGVEWCRRRVRPAVRRTRSAACSCGAPAREAGDVGDRAARDISRRRHRRASRSFECCGRHPTASAAPRARYCDRHPDKQRWPRTTGHIREWHAGRGIAMLQLDVVSLTAVTHVFAQDMRTRGRGKILLVASLLAYQGVEKFAVYAAAKAYVLRLGEALHRELKRDGVMVTVLCPGMSDTGFATAAQQKITPALKLLMMQPAPVVRAGIRALQAGRISVVPGWANKATVMFTRATPRWLHQAIFSRIMGAKTDRGDAYTASVGVARRKGALQ